MEKCSNCGALLREGSAFCSQCGKAVVRKVFCSKCGTELDAGDKFCSSCGAAVKEKESQAETPKKERKIDYSNLKLDDFDDVLEDADPADTFWKGVVSEDELEEEKSETKNVSSAKEKCMKSNDEVYPNLSNFKDLFSDIHTAADRHSGVRGGKLEVELRFDDRDSEITHPEYFLYGNFDIVRRTEDGKVPVKGLERLGAYALAENGIFFVKTKGNGTIGFMDSKGQIVELGQQDRAIAMSYESGKLTVEYVIDYHQVSAGEHRDLMGYMHEAWYDVYKVNTEKKIIRL